MVWLIQIMYLKGKITLEPLNGGFFHKVKLSVIEGFSTNEEFLFGEKTLVKPKLSNNELLSTIEGF